MTEQIASLTIDNSGAVDKIAEVEAGLRSIEPAADVANKALAKHGQQGAAAVENVGGAVENNTKRLAAYGRDFQSIARALGIYTDAAERVQRVTEQAKRAVDAGRISQEQANKVIEEARLRYDETARTAAAAAKEVERAAQDQARATEASQALVPEPVRSAVTPSTSVVNRPAGFTASRTSPAPLAVAKSMPAMFCAAKAA
ncbi:ABC-type transporter Mla subunit MlaD [Azospirillum rugosum]|uniref:ABC-type transporter Mla subunit MlaD n=1 Tax=Azospirillum rugosum TaxID=416170 RepID=A0ABS4SEN8_9PROT|nr:ABC-type transporter Mla subunit MlaD [Azospirillum rugosum]MDQ0524888.1 ABC-type transporter Mla subunit MlaD [Azospirillum rugosum]